MADSGFPNTIREGIPWSADLDPQGPRPTNMDHYTRKSGNPQMADDDNALISQTDPYGYDGLPDIAVPKHRVS